MDKGGYTDGEDPVDEDMTSVPSESEHIERGDCGGMGGFDKPCLWRNVVAVSRLLGTGQATHFLFFVARTDGARPAQVKAREG